jgi:iron complex outermembrane receptor protein
MHEGLDHLLEGTGLTYRFGGPDAKAVSIILAQNDAVRSDAGAEALPPIDVGAEAPRRAVGAGRAGGAGAADATAYKVPNATTALKIDAPIMNTPVSIQVVPHQVLQDQQATTMARAVDNVSGVRSFNSSYVGGNDQFQLRGFTSSLTYYDGLRTNFGIPGSSGMSDVERVEVLKGPASILYGRAEPGGLVNIVTKKPQATPRYMVEQMFGSWDTYRTTFDATGPLDKEGTLLYRVTGEIDHEHNFRQFNEIRNYVVSPVVQWLIDDATQLTVSFQYAHQHKPFDAGTIAFTKYDPLSKIFGVGPATFIPRERTFIDANSNHKVDMMRIGYDWSHKFNESWKLTNRFQVWTSEAENFMAVAVGGDPADPTMLTRFHVANNGRPSVYSTNLDLTGEFDALGARHKLLIGADGYYRRDVGSFFGIRAATPLSFLFPVYGSTPNSNSSYTRITPGLGSSTREAAWGVYVQDLVELPYNVFVMAGGRYDRVTNQSNNFAGDGDILGSNDQRVSPRVGLLWRPIPEMSLYGSYIENFGSANGRTGPVGQETLLPPETAKQWEVGVKSEIFDGRLMATLAYYNLVKQNVATPDANPLRAAAGFSVAAGEIRNKGVEFDLSGEILPGWRVIGGYAYIDSIVARDNGDVFDPLGNLISRQGVAGFIPAGVSRHMGSVWSTYEIQNEELRGLKFGGGVTARSASYGDRINSFHVPGYATVGFMGAYEWFVDGAKLTAQLNIDNLLDTRFYPEATRGAFAVDVGAPRRLRGSIRMEF